MKFRVIQSNNRGLISKVGDQTFYSRKPKVGEETISLPTLFIWVSSPLRYAARAWTKWNGHKLNEDFIYEVTKFRDVIDISGMNFFHQWSSQNLRQQLWEMQGKVINVSKFKCPEPHEVWVGDRNKNSKYLRKRNNLIKKNLKKLSEKEKKMISKIYQEKNNLNLDAGFIKYHVDHIKPLSKGGLHEFNNLQIITAHQNQIKGSKLTT